MAQSRITIRDLNAVCSRINRLTKSPEQAYIKDVDNNYYAQIGNYHISRAYGGYSLHRMATAGGGVNDVLSIGHVPARELYNSMHNFIRGFNAAGQGE